jgi:hydroxyethylthiazole kinase-like uncharacterized protein yjeF
VIDGLLGIGGKGGLREPAVQLARTAEECGAPIVAVDLPSGIDADTGQVEGYAIRATVTVTFGGYKPGLLIDPGASHAGVVEFVDIGLTAWPAEPAVESLGFADVANQLPGLDRATDKYGRGVVGIDCGSARYPGAALLAVGAAVRSGVGAVRYRGPVDVVSAHPEVLLGVGRVQAWVVGCGLDRDAAARERFDETLDADVPVLIDADGLALLAEAGPEALARRSAPTLLTPHSGEAARLLGIERSAVDAGRLRAVRELADRYGVTVLLKGSTTLIARPGESAGHAAGSDGHGPAVRVNTHATPALATAGSGDVLSGLIGGLLATGLAAFDAAAVGAYLHGATGLRAQRHGPVAAGDLLAALPLTWHNLVR